MGYIYKITNNITHKVYIGQTINSIAYRFATHKCNAKKGTNTYLYKSMRKYGIENFIIEVLEECDNNLLNEREKYWINFFNSNKEGYNLSIGGEATNQKYNYGEIVRKYLELQNQELTAQYFHCSLSTIYNACKKYNITGINKRTSSSVPRKVARLDKITQEILEIYPSIAAAGKIYGDASTIGKVCRGSRKSAYGYQWIYIND